YAAQVLTASAYQQILTQELTLASPSLSVQAGHFLRHVRRLDLPTALLQHGQLRTTLDASLQQRARAPLEGRLPDLHALGVTDGALLVVDHHTSAVLAWVSAGGSQIDAVTTPRQPGSTLKPLLYALALEHGWTAATLVEDSPLEQPIGAGLHTYRNYSGQHYGPLRVREALGNSLNVPAVRTINFVGVEAFLECLHRLGFHSLTQSADYYGNGLALGNGEVTLFELVQPYAALPARASLSPCGSYRLMWQPQRRVGVCIAPRSVRPSPISSPIRKPEAENFTVPTCCGFPSTLRSRPVPRAITGMPGQ